MIKQTGLLDDYGKLIDDHSRISIAKLLQALVNWTQQLKKRVGIFAIILPMETMRSQAGTHRLAAFHSGHTFLNVIVSDNI